MKISTVYKFDIHYLDRTAGWSRRKNLKSPLDNFFPMLFNDKLYQKEICLSTGITVKRIDQGGGNEIKFFCVLSSL